MSKTKVLLLIIVLVAATLACSLSRPNIPLSGAFLCSVMANSKWTDAVKESEIAFVGINQET